MSSFYVERNVETSRRDFLKTGAAATAVLLGSPLGASAQNAPKPDDNGHGPNPTPDAALKFARDGKPKPFAGNTVICHLPAQCRFRDGATALHDALQAAPFAHKLGILPPDSYHMTIFPGANDQARQRSAWPGGVPLDASVEECDRVMTGRMQAVQLAGPFPLRVRIDVPRTLAYGRASTLRMQGADAAAERTLRTIRDEISKVYRYRSPQHDSYGFHISFAYTLEDFTPGEMQAYRALLAKAVDRLRQETPVLELGLPEFCTFPDMFRFEPVHLL